MGLGPKTKENKMAKLWIDEEQYDVKSTRVLIENGKIYLGKDEFILKDLEGHRVKMSVKPGAVVIQTEEKKNEKAS
jgi:hypothetical protein